MSDNDNAAVAKATIWLHRLGFLPVDVESGMFEAAASGDIEQGARNLQQRYGLPDPSLTM